MIPYGTRAVAEALRHFLISLYVYRTGSLNLPDCKSISQKFASFCATSESFDLSPRTILLVVKIPLRPDQFLLSHKDLIFDAHVGAFQRYRRE